MSVRALFYASTHTPTRRPSVGRRFGVRASHSRAPLLEGAPPSCHRTWGQSWTVQQQFQFRRTPVLAKVLAVVVVTLGVMWRLGTWPFAVREPFDVTTKALINAVNWADEDRKNYTQPIRHATYDGKLTVTCPNGSEWDGNGCKI